MIGKLSIALLMAASPALAQDSAPADTEGASEAQAAPVAYKTKRVCRSIEVVGSSIPRTTCTTKKIPIRPVEQEADSDSEQVKHAEALKGE
jgi:hypothetical protein